jgi:hypothetical protein
MRKEEIKLLLNANDIMIYKETIRSLPKTPKKIVVLYIHNNFVDTEI